MKNLITLAISKAWGLKNWAMAHKLAAGVALAAAIGVTYGIYSAATAGTAQAKYVLATVEKGTIVSSINGSGQVSVSRSVDIKSKASGDVTYVAVNDGQEVYAGQLLVIVDPTDAEKSVRDAQTSLDKAKLDLQKLQGGATAVGIFRGTTDKATSDLERVYISALNELSSAFLDYPVILAELDNIVTSDSISGQKYWNVSYYANSIREFSGVAGDYKDNIIATLQNAKKSYEQSAAAYKNISLSSNRADLDDTIKSAYDTAKLLAVVTKSATDLIQLYSDELSERDITPNVLSETHLSSLVTYSAKINSHLSSLTSIQDSAQTQKEAVFNAGIGISDQQIKVRQAEDALTDAKTDLANHYVRAPFTGVVSKVNVRKYDTASGAVATLLTKEKIAQLSLNEIDAVKVKAGQKATLTFDAIENIRVEGEVAEVDVAGTVSQGVVTYNLKISFASDDARIKSGMSVSAEIITDSKVDVLVVPASAVRDMGRASAVSIVDEKVPQNMANLQGILLPNPPRPQIVETGVSNDLLVEIVSGLKEGDQIVVRTITGAAAKTASTQGNNSLFQVGQGGRGGATGNIRAGGGGSGGATFISR